MYTPIRFGDLQMYLLICFFILVTVILIGCIHFPRSPHFLFNKVHKKRNADFKRSVYSHLKTIFS